jgi:integrase
VASPLPRRATRVGNHSERVPAVIENVINPAIGNVRLREATAERLQRLIKSQGSHSRRKKMKTVLKMIFDAAVLDDALCSPCSPPAVDAWMTKKRPGPKPNMDMPDIVDLLLATGCRIGEVLAIRWSEVDLAADPPTVSITGTIKTETGGHLPESKAQDGLLTAPHQRRSGCRTTMPSMARF